MTGDPHMFSLLGLAALAMGFSANRDDGDDVAAHLMSQADACNGSDPHEAQALRQAACAYLSVVAQR